VVLGVMLGVVLGVVRMVPKADGIVGRKERVVTGGTIDALVNVLRVEESLAVVEKTWIEVEVPGAIDGNIEIETPLAAQIACK
jgi:hypothetical protein